MARLAQMRCGNLGLLAVLALAIPIAMAFTSLQSSAQTASAPHWWQTLAPTFSCKANQNPNDSTTLSVCESDLRTVTEYNSYYRGRLSIYKADMRSFKPSSDNVNPLFINIIYTFRTNDPEYEYSSGHKLSGVGKAGARETTEDCTAGNRIVTDSLKSAEISYKSVKIKKCEWGLSALAGAYSATISIEIDLDIGASSSPATCSTDLLKGSWRAEAAALAKTGHAVTFAAAPNIPKHDGGQVAQRGAFSTYPAHKNILQLLPNPLFTSARGYPAGKDQCLIPVVSQRDSGTSRSAALIDTKTSTLRFVTERAYRWEGNAYRLNAVNSNLVGGMEGRWLRGAAAALPKTCTPADFNGRWDRSDGARVTIRGAGTQGVGGTGSMDDHPENWVRGQNKYTSIRMKSACVYTAKCYASQRTTINGRPDFKMVETACELVIDPETKTLRERGTSNSYTYTKAGADAAARKPPSAVTPSEPAQPSEAVQALNSQQAAAAKREIQAYEARKKAIADEQAAKEAAYRKALADREALIAENNRRAAEARAKWEASAAACRAGDQSQCAPQPQR